MSNKTFVLGAGAQKAGTTWLHSYLSSINCVDLGIFKEYHVLDAIYIPECRYYRSNYDIKSYLKRLIKSAVDKRHRSRYSFQDNTENYFDFFENILNANDSISITGDITPSYTGLPVECYEHVSENFSRRNIRVKAVVLLRDPLERCWSAVRMHRRRKKTNFENVNIHLDEENALKNYFSTREAEIRTRYDQTIQNLESVFDTEDIFVGFYETFLDSGTGEIERLSKFLNVDYVKPDYSKKFNVSKKNNRISDVLKAEVVDHYSDVYRFVSDRYGRDFVRGIWSGAKLVV